MEGELIPWVHYIPVRRDLGDLYKKVCWARNNERECLKIVENANMFMSQFKNELYAFGVLPGKGPELSLIKTILDTYGKNVRITNFIPSWRNLI